MTDKNRELLTQEGFEKLQEELNYLTEVRRREVADRIRRVTTVSRRRSVNTQAAASKTAAKPREMTT